MQKLDSIVGQSAAIELLTRMIARDRVPHALLFQGAEGIGKATTARAFAWTLLCSSADERPCGNCESCAALAAQLHPAYHEVKLLPRTNSSGKPDPSGETVKIVKVDQIRELTRQASFAPRFGNRRVFVIDPADAMNREAQNALLKTLEEPPGAAVLILIASRPHSLLSTVRSRSFALRFATLDNASLARVLVSRGVDAEEAHIRAALAEGRPGWAMALDLDELIERREVVLETLEQLAGSPRYIGSIPGRAADWAGKTESEFVRSLDLALGLLRDAALCASDGPLDSLVHTDQADRLATLGQRLGRARAAGLVESFSRARDQLRFNVNRTLMAETVLASVAGGPPL